MHGDDRARFGALPSLRTRAAGGHPGSGVVPVAPLYMGVDRSAPPPCHTRGGMALRIARKPVGFLGPRSHGIAVIGTPESFREGSDKSAPPCQPSEGRDVPEDREKACPSFGYLQSWHCRGRKSATLSERIERSAPPSLPCEGRDGSDVREEACRIFGPRSPGIAVMGNPASFQQRSKHQRLPHCQARGGMVPRIARKLVGFSGTRSHGVAMIGDRPPFYKGSRDQRLPACPARGGMAPRIARKPAGFLGPHSHGIAVWKYGALSQGISNSGPPSLASEERDGSENREKACCNFGYPQSWHCHAWKSVTFSQGIQRSTPPPATRGAGWLR